MVVTDKFIFCHVPKCAGQSVSQALGGRTPGLPLHAPLRYVAKKDRFAFGTIRNPWSRMVSLYRFLVQKQFRDTDHFDQAAVREMGFKRWLLTDSFWMQQDLKPKGPDKVDHPDWIGPGENISLPPMQRRPQTWWLDGCDYVMRFEYLVEDFAVAMQKLDMRPPRLGHVNRTDGGDWRAEYCEETRDFVAEHFAEDITFGGYKFD